MMEESNLNTCADKSPAYLNTNVPEVKNTQARVQQYANLREKRIESFLAHVYEKRSDYIKSLLPSRPVMLNKPPTIVNC